MRCDPASSEGARERAPLGNWSDRFVALFLRIGVNIETAQSKIQPARGVKVTESGEIILTAYPTDNSGDRQARRTYCDRSI